MGCYNLSLFLIPASDTTLPTDAVTMTALHKCNSTLPYYITWICNELELELENDLLV